MLLAQTTGPAGQWTVTTLGPTTVVYGTNSVTLSWTTPTPPTPPPSPPTPTPIPVLAGHVWALAIYDPVIVLPAGQQAALDSVTLRTATLLQDVDFQAFKSTDANVSSWIPHLPAGGLPALLFIQKSPSGTGQLAYATILPGSEPEIVLLVNKIRGK